MPDELNNLPETAKQRFTDQTCSMVFNPELDEILNKYFDDVQNGRACNRDELLARHPDLADELAECLDGIEMVSGLGVGSDLMPQKLGDFEIIRPIGRGAMGVVYLANQISLKRPVALKVLRCSVTGKQATARFEREAELVATLQHANIVPIYATGKHDGMHFLAMQLIEGPSLSQWSAAQDADRKPTTLAKWAAEVARALAHAHQRDVIHRDVKPSNLLQDADQKVWLTDFGLARRFDDLRMSMTGAMLGTPNYMSPEQASPSRYPIDHRTDIYSLGATLFELLTGRCVFLAETPHAVLAQVLAEEPPRLRELLPDASQDLETILMKCLEKEPRNRYQTAQQLADDLEAFAGGRSIKARRPGIIERATRWKRHNKKAVAWAFTSAAVAVVGLIVCAASWMGWNNFQLGDLKIESDEGPIVGRLIDAKGEPSSVFTIPTERPMPIRDGRYTLQTWASGRMGVNQELSVDRGQVTEIFSRMLDDTVFPERTVQGIPAVLPLGDRDDLVFFHNQGLTRVDGRTGKDLWTASASDFVKAVNTSNASAEDEEADQQGKQGDGMPKPVPIRPFVWRFDGQYRYHTNRMPVVTHGFPDVNNDGLPEVMVANHSHPSLLTFDGKSGKLLWQYTATRSTGKANAYSGAIHTPRDIGDIDGDGIADFATVFRRGKHVEQWLDAVSGKTGERIWRKQLPKKLVGNIKYNLSVFCQINEQGFFPTRSNVNSSGLYRDRASYSADHLKTVAAWPPIPIAGKNGSQNSLLLVCGSKLIVCDATTGEATDFNQSQPLELGFVPAIEPKLIRSAQANEQPIGILLCEIVSVPSNNKKTRAKPVTRFSMRSLETAEELWCFDAACDLNWTGIKPDWPLVADLTGDAVPEILIADGASLEIAVNMGAPRQSSLQAVDAVTGKPIWDVIDVAKIRCQDRQIQRLLMGPDADDDSIDDVYVVSSMKGRDLDVSRTFVYVDILSASTGKRIRTTRSEVPAFARNYNGVDFERPFFLGVGSDGYPRLVVATMRMRDNQSRQSTVLISTGTGMVTNVGDELEYPLLADGDGDGQRDLFLIKPRRRSQVYEAGQLVSIKSEGGCEQIFAKGEYLPIDDVDGDDVHDVLNKTNWQLISGSTGKRLWQWTYRAKEDHRLKLLDGDIDGDETKDLLVAEFSGRGSEKQTILTLVSGRKGRVIWQKKIPSTNSRIEDFSVHCEDMNGDESTDLVLLHRFNRHGATYRNLVCYDGMSGTMHWDLELEQNAGFYNPRKEPMFIADMDDDGNPDVLCQRINSKGTKSTIAVNGWSGELLYEFPVIAGQPNLPSSSSQSFFGRSKLLPTGVSKAIEFVTATTVGKNSVRVDFHDIKDGKRVSTWDSDGQFKAYSFNSVSPPGPWNGIPFAVNVDEDCFAGVCVRNRKTKKLQLVVLDASGPTAKVVQRIDIPKLGIYNGSMATDMFVIVDANDDGQTDVVFHDGSDLVATDLISNKEINRRQIPASSPKLSPVRFDPSLLQLTTNEGRDSVDGEDNRLKLIDLKTFDVVWDIYSPPAVFVEGLLSVGTPDVSDLQSTLPRILYRGNPEFQRVVATEAEYKGDNAEVRRQIPQVAATPVSFSTSNFQDPRMVESLPWANWNALNRNQAREILRFVTNGLLIVIGAVLFPFFFAKKMITKKRWSMKTLLLWPLLFAIPYLVLQLPLEVNDEFRFTWNQSLRKLATACLLILPSLAYVTVWVKALWQGNWVRLGLLTIVPLAIAIVLGGTILLGYRHLPAGSRYDWYDLGSIKLVFSGVYLIGVVLLGTWFCSFIVRALNGLRKRIFGRPKLVTS